MKITLGTKVRDVITGFEGMATGRAEYLTGCVQVCVSPRIGDDGKVRDSHWFDEDRLEVVDAKPIALKIANAGGPQSNAAPRY